MCPGKTPNSPSTLGAVSSLTCSLSFTPSGVTISRLSCAASAMGTVPCASALADFAQLRSALLGFFDVADHVEGLLRQIVERAAQDLLEARDRLLEGHVLAGAAHELRGHEERLRQELLDLARSRHGQLVVLAELVHAEDRDDVLQILVTLQR